MKNTNTLKRPSCFNQKRKDYEITTTGLAMVHAVKAVREGQQALARMETATDGHYSTYAYSTIQARYTMAKRRYQERLRS